MPSTPSPAPLQGGSEVSGRRKLIEAALRLAAEKRGFQSIGIREVGREAGLNANTFYRHFADMEALALTVINERGDEFRRQLNARRATDLSPEEVNEGSVRWVFQFIRENPDAVLAYICELNGPFPSVRQRLREFIHHLAADMTESVKRRGRGAGLEDRQIYHMALTVIQHVVFVAADYMEFPERREEIEQWSIALIHILYSGGTWLRGR